MTNQHPEFYSQLQLDEGDRILLAETSEFNIEARYPEWKLEFYKRCTLSYTKKYFVSIEILYKKLCRELKREK